MKELRLAAEALDEEWKERIAVILKLGFTALCRIRGGKHTPDDFEPHPAYYPHVFPKKDVLD